MIFRAQRISARSHSLRGTALIGSATACCAAFVGAGLAVAQDTPPPPSLALCEAEVPAVSAVAEPSLVATCGKQSFPLGPIDSFRVVDLPHLGSSLVVTSKDGERRIWLLIGLDAGVFVREDISGVVARSAGRGASRNLKGLEIEIDGKGAEGELRALVGAGARSGSSGQGGVDLRDIVARARAVDQTAVEIAGPNGEESE